LRWTITVTGLERDVTRLLEAFPYLSKGASPSEVVLMFEDRWDWPTDESQQAIDWRSDAVVRHFNGACRLRYGHAFDGVTIKSYEWMDASGYVGSAIFVEPGAYQMTHDEFSDFEEFSDYMVTLGQPRPAPPFGLDDIEALDLEAVADLADQDADVARVLRLVDLMLVGDEDIDWSAAYSALEAIDADTRSRGADPDWYSKAQRKRFNQTANSIDAVGDRSRHGVPHQPPSKPMTFVEASWFVRGVTARWLTWRLSRPSHDADDQADDAAGRRCFLARDSFPPVEVLPDDPAALDGPELVLVAVNDGRPHVQQPQRAAVDQFPACRGQLVQVFRESLGVGVVVIILQPGHSVLPPFSPLCALCHPRTVARGQDAAQPRTPPGGWANAYRKHLGTGAPGGGWRKELLPNFSWEFRLVTRGRSFAGQGRMTSACSTHRARRLSAQSASRSSCSLSLPSCVYRFRMRMTQPRPKAAAPSCAFFQESEPSGPTSSAKRSRGRRSVGEPVPNAPTKVAKFWSKTASLIFSEASIAVAAAWTA